MSPIKGFSDLDIGTEPIYIDTVILVTMFTNHFKHPFGVDVQKIFAGLIHNNASFTTSSLTCDEVPSAIRNALLEHAINNRKPGDPKYAKFFLDADPGILRQVSLLSTHVLDSFDKLKPEYLEYLLLPRLAKMEREFSASINIDLNDAKHLIAAKSYGVSNFISCDLDYTKVTDPEMTIYLPDRMAASVTRIAISKAVEIPYFELPNRH